MLDRQEEKISRSLMTICNIFCFGQSDNSFWEGIWKADKYCNILKSHRCDTKAHRVINLEMAKILKEKGFSDVLPGQILC